MMTAAHGHCGAPIMGGTNSVNPPCHLPDPRSVHPSLLLLPRRQQQQQDIIPRDREKACNVTVTDPSIELEFRHDSVRPCRCWERDPHSHTHTHTHAHTRALQEGGANQGSSCPFPNPLHPAVAGSRLMVNRPRMLGCISFYHLIGYSPMGTAARSGITRTYRDPSTDISWSVRLAPHKIWTDAL